MRKIHRATAGAAFGLVLAAGFVPAIATAATATADVPSIPGATAERPIVDSRTSIYTVQGSTAQGDRDGNRLFVTGQATPEAQVTSSVTGGTLKIVDSAGHVLCIGTAKADRPNLYSCTFEPLVSGPQTITAAVVKKNGTYSTPTQAELDAYAATPTIDSVTRDGDDLEVVGHGNLRAGVEASTDRKTVVATGETDSDGSFRIRIPGGAKADQVFVRTVNDAIPAGTPDHDRFAASSWALLDAGSDAGEETPNPGEGGGSGEEAPNPGEGTGSGEETPNPGEGTGSGEETPNPGEGDGSGETVAPVYDVTSPAHGSEVTTAQPTFTGHGLPNARIRIQPQGGPGIGEGTVDAEGNWEVHVEGALQPGLNGLDFLFEQPGGTWERRVSQAVTYTPAVSRFGITTPADGSTVTEARPTIEGATVGAYRRIAISGLNNSAQAYGSTDADGNFRLTFDQDLEEGLNEFSVQYQDENGRWKSQPYSLRYDAGSGEVTNPGDGSGEVTNPGDGSGSGETPEPGDGEETPAPADVAVSTTRLSAAEVVLGFTGAAGTEVTASANGVTKHATIGEDGRATVVLPAPALLTSTVHVSSTNGDRTAEQDVVIGDGEHPSDQLAAVVASASAATGSAEIDVWGLGSGIGGLQAKDADGKVLAYSTMGAEGQGHLTVTGLTAGQHVLTIVSGGLSTQVTVTI